MQRNDRWTQTILLLAALKVGLGILCFFGDPEIAVPSPQLRGIRVGISLPPEVNLVQLLAFGAASGLMLVGGKRDRSAVFLGCFFLASGSSFADRLLKGLASGAQLDATWLAAGLRFLSQLPLESTAAYFLWGFVAGFPDISISFRAQRAIRLAMLTSGAVAASLLGACVVVAGGQMFGRSLGTLLGALQDAALGLYLLSALAAFITLQWKGRQAKGREKRRVGLFIGALLLLAAPVSLDILLEMTWAGYVASLSPRMRLFRVLIDNAMILGIPFATAYSVLVHRVFDVKLIARKALQYILARSTVLVLLTTPFIWLCFFLYLRRSMTLAGLFSGSQLPLLLGTLAVGGLGVAYRSRILEAVDRRFFRERLNARLILTQLVYQIRQSNDWGELSNLVCRGVDLAFRLENAALLVADTQGQLMDPRGGIRPLDLGSQLATWIHGQKDPLEIDLTDLRSPLRNLPVTERHWLVDGRVRMLAPIFKTDGSLLALLVLGPKKSELPFLREDYQLLTAIASSAGLALELLRLKQDTGMFFADHGGADPSTLVVSPIATDRATECLACGQVYGGDIKRCPRCKITVEPTLVPYVLRGMFRFDQRIGAGGMAVVYRATDLKLGRTVAIKTLPRVSPEAAMRLQKEARTAATVSHAGLAAVYGIETWEGTPMLILELLEGGTLADRLGAGPLPPLEVIRTGQAVALALEQIHSVGILHRDIKPSNIGYTRDGVPKLLDFGIARIHRDLRRDRTVAGSGENAALDQDSWQEKNQTYGHIAGTLPYLSPEVIQGDEPDPSLDLWSLAVVLYEALAGENLFAGARLAIDELLATIRAARLPPIATRVPSCPPPLAGFFTAALNSEKVQRPQSGQEFYSRLEEVRRALA